MGHSDTQDHLATHAEGQENAQRVSELMFSDLYLGHPTLGDRLANVPGEVANPVMAGPELKADLQELLAACHKGKQESLSGTDFRLDYDGVKYRVSVMPSVHGEVFVLRKMTQTLKTLKELRIPTMYAEALLAPNMTGLLLVSGAMNSGKTSTACALMRELLLKYGGVGVTSEDPIELPLEGQHGTGVCFQTQVAKSYAESAKNVVRWGAKYIFIGEIRDGAVAVEALRAGVNGHLVISTIHSDSPLNTLRRIQAMANESFEPAAAQALLSDGLAGVFHQKLSEEPRRLTCELLMVKGQASVMNKVRLGQFEQLATEINMQQANLIMKN